MASAKGVIATSNVVGLTPGKPCVLVASSFDADVKVRSELGLGSLKGSVADATVEFVSMDQKFGKGAGLATGIFLGGSAGVLAGKSFAKEKPVHMVTVRDGGSEVVVVVTDAGSVLGAIQRAQANPTMLEDAERKKAEKEAASWDAARDRVEMQRAIAEHRADKEKEAAERKAAKEAARVEERAQKRADAVEELQKKGLNEEQTNEVLEQRMARRLRVASVLAVIVALLVIGLSIAVVVVTFRWVF